MVLIFTFILGLMFGSFLNVCIYRLPKSESIVMPRSHCVKCGHVLAWYENIPVLSYLALLGRCRKCRKRISFVYPLVELLTGVLAVIIVSRYGLTPKAGILFIFFCALIVSTFIDFRYQEIPDVITLPGIIIAVGIAVFYPAFFEMSRLGAVRYALTGMLVGGGLVYLVGYLGELAFKKEAIGGGDIKLLAMIGALLGWQNAVLTFFIAPFLGIFSGLIAKLKEGKEVIPYGPYLSLASLVALLWGKDIIKYFFPY